MNLEDKILDLLSKHKEGLTTREIGKILYGTDRCPDTVVHALARLRFKGLVKPVVDKGKKAVVWRLS